MKKTISLLLVFCMMLSILPTAFAVDVSCGNCGITGSKNFTECPQCHYKEFCTNCGICYCGYSTQHSMTVQYGVAESYLVMVPDAARIDQDGLGNINVSVSDALLASNATLKVYVTGDSYTNGYWHLTNRDNAANKLQYTISKNSAALGADDEVLSVAAGQAWNSTVTAALQLQLETDVSQAGTYSDTLTFVVDYQKAANLQLNEYGFYYEQPYKVDKDGVTLQFVFYEEGYVTGWVSGLSEEAGIQPWTMNNGKIETGGFSFAIQNDGMTLFDNTIADDTFTLNLNPVVHANDIDGTFTSNVMGVDVVCDKNNVTMYQNGTYIDSIPKSSLTWDKGIIYRNGEPYGFYYPDATMFAMIQAIEDYGASGILFIKEQKELVPAGAYGLNVAANDSDIIRLPAQIEERVLAIEDNWFAEESQELYASIMRAYGFDIIPLAIPGGYIDEMTVMFRSDNGFMYDIGDTRTNTFIVAHMVQEGAECYVPFNIATLITIGIDTFSVDAFEANQMVAQAIQSQYNRWHNTVVELQTAWCTPTDMPLIVYFVEGMTWQEWWDNGYIQGTYFTTWIVQDGYVYATSTDAQLYHNGQPVRATETIVANTEYAILRTFTIDGEECSTFCRTWQDFCQSPDLPEDNAFINYTFSERGVDATNYIQVSYNGRTGYLAWDNEFKTKYSSYYIPSNAELTIVWEN